MRWYLIVCKTGPPITQTGSLARIVRHIDRPTIRRTQKTPITSEGAHKCSSYYHESGVLFVENVGQHMTVLPEVDMMLSEVKIEDIQVGDPGVQLTKEQEELRQLI